MTDHTILIPLVGSALCFAASGACLTAIFMSSQTRKLRNEFQIKTRDLRMQLIVAEERLNNTKRALAESQGVAEERLKGWVEETRTSKQLREVETRLWDDIGVLRAQLAEATKNDTRDPKTGRYVKAVGLTSGTEWR